MSLVFGTAAARFEASTSVLVSFNGEARSSGVEAKSPGTAAVDVRASSSVLRR